ncbi:MAG: GTPase domain-containing protein [Candidatus Njordarchaeales archaeon]
MSGSSEERLPVIRVGLYGPAKSGKTTFRKVFFGQEDSREYIPSEKVEVFETVRTFFQVKEGRKIPVETYKLALIDTPGREEFTNERLVGLSKCVGIILFYDANDPVSPQLLGKMVEEEVIGGGLIQNIVALVVVGTRKDLGINKEAVIVGQEVADRLTREIRNLWNYEVPHLLINAYNADEVTRVIEITESLLMTFRPPQKLIESLSASNILQAAIAPEAAPFVQPLIEIPVIGEEEREKEQKTETVEVATPREKSAMGAEGATKAKYKLIPSSKAWDLLRNMASKYPEIEKILLIAATPGGDIYTAFYPGEPTLENIPENLVSLIVALGKSLRNVLVEEDMGDLKYAILHGTNKSIIYTKLKEGRGIMVVKTRKKPSEELIKFLVE